MARSDSKLALDNRHLARPRARLLLAAMLLPGCWLAPYTPAPPVATPQPQPPEGSTAPPLASAAPTTTTAKIDIMALLGTDVDTATPKLLEPLHAGMTREEVEPLLPGVTATKDDCVNVKRDSPGVEQITICFDEGRAQSLQIQLTRAASTPLVWEELVRVATAKYGAPSHVETVHPRVSFLTQRVSLHGAEGILTHSIRLDLDPYLPNPAPRDLDTILGPEKGKPPKLLEGLRAGMDLGEVRRVIAGPVEVIALGPASRQRIIINDVPGVRAVELHFLEENKKKLARAEIVFRPSVSGPAGTEELYAYLVKKLGPEPQGTPRYWRKAHTMMRRHGSVDSVSYDLDSK